MNPTAARYADRSAQLTAILDAVGDRWDSPTPCEGWAVRDVVDHLVDTQRDFLARQDLDLGAAPDPADDPSGDPAGVWRRHAAAVVGVLDDDDVADREYDGYFGRTTIADTMADFYGWDLVIHGWDIARATGQPWSVDDDEAERLSATADGWGPALYSEGICSPAIDLPDDAGATDRLLARLGRDPQWAPA